MTMNGGRPSSGGRLLARLDDRRIPATAAGALAGVLAFEDEAPTPITVHRARGLTAIGETLDQLALEHIGVVAMLGPGRIGRRQVEQDAEFQNEHLEIGPLVAAVAGAVVPAGDEGRDGLVDDGWLVHDRRSGSWISRSCRLYTARSDISPSAS
jgi:hypothetical protein